MFAHAASGFHEVVNAQTQANIEAGANPSDSADGRDGSVRSSVKESSQSLYDGWLHWTRVVDLAIQRHKDLNRLNLRIVSRDLARFVHVFVRQVFDCMTEDFEGAAGLNRNVTALIRLGNGVGYGVVKSAKGQASCRHNHKI